MSLAETASIARRALYRPGCGTNTFCQTDPFQRSMNVWPATKLYDQPTAYTFVGEIATTLKSSLLTG